MPPRHFPVVAADVAGSGRLMGPMKRRRSTAPGLCSRHDIIHDLLLNRRRCLYREMSKFCMGQVHVSQQAVEMLAALYRNPQTTGKIKVLQEMDITGYGSFGDGVERNDQGNVNAG